MRRLSLCVRNVVLAFFATTLVLIGAIWLKVLYWEISKFNATAVIAIFVFIVLWIIAYWIISSKRSKWR